MDSFEALAAELAEWPGWRLLTVMALDDRRGVNRRVWSSDPAIWPPGGEKPMPRDGEMFRVVVVRGVARFCDGAAEIEAAFADHALILAAGCQACVNVPLRVRGRTVGALNLLHQAEQYAGLDVARLGGACARAAALLA